MDSLIRMVGISKRFGTIQALRNVDFHVNPQEIVGLVGDNGAGKTTLIKVLTGVYKPDHGQIFFKGKEVHFSSPADAISRGIMAVHQAGSLIDEMTVWENFFLGRELVRNYGIIRLLDKRRCRTVAREILRRIGIDINVDQLVGTLSGGQRQAIAIGRAMYFGGELLLLDEPTAALSLKETAEVLKYIENAREAGSSVVLVSHLTLHVYPIADRFVVLERGDKIADVKKEDVTARELEELIIWGRQGLAAAKIAERMKGGYHEEARSA
ncbi:ATP-binding cassette domain-containing protein [uncultured Thermanaerothrix sp.]|uniref:ATP-binding cassette domain-containing protein n=1 Tax=uncultured Thermanaerothrix sp. TaxID=1195149 RepID=UPI002628DD4B|nr:ATP-binding cassette domain-containing protein [uncultured Thermanaerothrix sp.]